MTLQNLMECDVDRPLWVPGRDGIVMPEVNQEVVVVARVSHILAMTSSRRIVLWIVMICH